MLAILFGLIGWGLSAWPKHIPVPLPNGADEVIPLAGSIPKRPEGPNYTEAPASEIRAWIAATPAFRSTITTLLKKEFLVRNTYSNSSVRLMMALRELEKRLLAEARDESVPVADRMEICLITYELGSRGTRGGAMFDGIVSAAVRINSLRNLSTCSSNATSAQLKSAAVKLGQLIKQAPTLEDYRDGEVFFASTVPVKVKIESWIEDLKGDGLTKIFAPLIGAFEPKMTEINRIEQGTLRDLVVRSYTMDKGSPPTTWSDLIPAHLSAALVDPVGKTNLSLIPGTIYKFSSE